MRNANTADPVQPLPEIKVPGTFGKAVHWITQIKPIVWLYLTLITLSVVIFFIPEKMWFILWHGITTHKLITGSLLLFAFIAMSLLWTVGQRIDVWVFMLINKKGSRPLWLDKSMLCYTQIGNGIFAYTVAAILFLFNYHVLFYELIFGTLVLWLNVEFIKVILQRGRPYSFLPDIRIVGHKERGHSFPSGHTSQAFFMASLLSHYFHADILITILLYTAAAIVGITRIYVGMHYPRDVLGGVIMGTVGGFIAFSINPAIWVRLF